jgi:hypothetical protein
VGKSALAGLKGVREVTRGFHHFREVNRVTYDGNRIDLETMIDALKRAGTYVGIAGKGGAP